MAALATGIVSDPDVMDGEPIIEGTRVRVATLYRAAKETDLDPATVAEKYGVSTADVHRAIAYHYDNPEEMARHEQLRRDLKQQALDKGAKTLAELRNEHEQGQHGADAS